MYSDVCSKLSNHFGRMKAVAFDQAKSFQNKYLLSIKLEGLGLEEKLTRFIRDREANERKIICFPRKDFMSYTDFPSSLQKNLLAGLLFRCQQENKHLVEAIELRENQKFFDRLVSQTKAQLPAPRPAREKKQVFSNARIFEELFEQAYHIGEESGQARIVDFQNMNPFNPLKKKRYHAAVSTKMNNHLKQYQALEKSELYGLLGQDKERMKLHFVKKCRQGFDLDRLSLDLQEIVSLKVRHQFLTQALLLVDGEATSKAQNTINCHFFLKDIQSRMLPDAESIEWLDGLILKIENDQKNGKPLFLIKKDEEYSFDAIFKKNFEKLKASMASLPVERRYIFILYMRLDLRSTRGAAMELDILFRKYYDALIVFFDEQWEYIKNVKMDKCPLFEDILQERLQDMKLPVSQWSEEIEKAMEPTSEGIKDSLSLGFHYNVKTKDQLKAVLQALVHLGAISSLVTLPQFRSYFNGSIPSVPLRWRADQGDLMSFIKEALRVMGKDFCPRRKHWIVAAQCFVKADGSAFKANKLKSSKPTSLEYQMMAAARKFK